MTGLRVLLVAPSHPAVAAPHAPGGRWTPAGAPEPGALARHVAGLARELARCGHEVTVAVPAPGGTAGRTRADGVTVYRLPATAARLAVRPGVPAAPVPDPELRRGLARVLHAERPQVVHAHGAGYASAAGPARQARVPLVLTLHDHGQVCPTRRLTRPDGRDCAGPSLPACMSCAGGWHGPVTGAALALAHRAARPTQHSGLSYVVAVSTDVARRGRLVDGTVPWSVVPDFVPADQLAGTDRPGTGAGDDPDLPAGPFLLYAGGGHHDDGYDTLLAAYHRLPGPGRPPLLCVGAGTGAVPLPAGVRAVGPWPWQRVLAAMRRCTLAVVPGRWPDPCPATVLAAMAAGRPVLATRTGGVPDLVLPGRTGLLVEPGDAPALAAALAGLLADPVRARALGAAGRRRVVDFTDRAVAGRLVALYRRLAGLPAPAAAAAMPAAATGPVPWSGPATGRPVPQRAAR